MLENTGQSFLEVLEIAKVNTELLIKKSQESLKFPYTENIISEIKTDLKNKKRDLKTICKRIEYENKILKAILQNVTLMAESEQVSCGIGGGGHTQTQYSYKYK